MTKLPNIRSGTMRRRGGRGRHQHCIHVSFPSGRLPSGIQNMIRYKGPSSCLVVRNGATRKGRTRQADNANIRLLQCYCHGGACNTRYCSTTENNDRCFFSIFSTVWLIESPYWHSRTNTINHQPEAAERRAGALHGIT